METLIIYLDDAAYADQILAPMLAVGAPTRCVLVACAPRMSRRIGKWLSHSSRENWRNKWCDKLFAHITPVLMQRHPSAQLAMEYVVAQGPLPELTQQLRTRFGVARVVDARRPKFGQAMVPVTHEQPIKPATWQIPGAVGSLSALLVLAAE
jgi:hypothetical protein